MGEFSNYFLRWFFFLRQNGYLFLVNLWWKFFGRRRRFLAYALFCWRLLGWMWARCWYFLNRWFGNRSFGGRFFGGFLFKLLFEFIYNFFIFFNFWSILLLNWRFFIRGLFNRSWLWCCGFLGSSRLRDRFFCWSFGLLFLFFLNGLGGISREFFFSRRLFLLFIRGQLSFYSFSSRYNFKIFSNVLRFFLMRILLKRVR